MSFIKSDSLFSNIMNAPFRPDLRLNESSSNIFKSIFENIEPGAKQIRISSVLDFGGTFKPVQQSQYLMNKNQDFFKKETGTQSYHYNWVVCRNSGLSQDQDNGDECQNQITPHKKEPFLMESEGKSTQQKCQTPVIQNQPVVEPKKIKNETKNIPKNYGKAIISFIEKNRPFIEEITQRFKVDYDQFLWDLKQKKKVINTIADLRTLWSNYKYSKCMRVVSSLFLRKFALKYIFDSRICTYSSHIKYRQRLCEALSDPEQFRHIKDY